MVAKKVGDAKGAILTWLNFLTHDALVKATADASMNMNMTVVAETEGTDKTRRVFGKLINEILVSHGKPKVTA
jgi:hypothetical protein